MKRKTLCLLLLCAVGCAKKESKPQRTEPWLAHPPAQASASNATTRPLTRYALDQRSVIHFEVPTKRGALSGSVTRVSGELDVDLSDLTRSHGLVRAELGSLDIHAAAGEQQSDAPLLARARAALELSPDASAPALYASFDLKAVEDASASQVEPAPAREAGTPISPFNRRVQFTANGELLLHGFRVSRRAPLSADFGFSDDRRVPRSVVIRSRSPFVVSLEMHAIVALTSESGAKLPSAPLQAREVRVSVELYGTKID